MRNYSVTIRKIRGVKGLLSSTALFDNEKIAELAKEYNFDWHSRKIFFNPFFRALILFQIDNSSSLRDWGSSINNSALYRFVGAHMDVSVPALSMALAKKDPEIFIDILRDLMIEINYLSSIQKLGRDISKVFKEIQDLLTNTNIFDSTTWELSSKLCKWAKYSNKQAGIRAHLKLNSGYGGVEKLIITSAKDNDTKYFEDFLNLDQDSQQIYLFDCGYKKLTTYDKITDSSNYFVTKLHGQILYDIIEVISNKTKILANGFELHSDNRVRIGTGRNQAKNTYRIIIGKDSYGNDLKILTNMVDLSVEQIVLLYQYRWTIEIVFRWLKHSLKLKRFISNSANGIVIQILIALIVYCLLVLRNKKYKQLSVHKLLLELENIKEEIMFIAGVEFGILIGRGFK